MASQLYLKDSYLSPIYEYIISRYIREYDISQANINILLTYGVISKSKYDELANKDKLSRQIEIGYLIRDNKEASKILSDGFTEARRMFFEANQIEDHEVLSIKKDAIYILNREATITDFGNINFVLKNVYTSFYKFPNLELYYYLDTINKIEKLDVKGIDDKLLFLHQDFFLDFLKFIFESAQTSHITEVITFITGFYEEYLNKSLNINYYREFNSLSKFRVSPTPYTCFFADYLEDNNWNKSYIDIGNNRDILDRLKAFYSNIYLSTVSQKTMRV